MGDRPPIIPEGWRRTDRPLRVAILGWARLSAQGAEGSGYNLNASDLAAGLVMSGHEVSYLRSGMDYSLVPGPRIMRVPSWRGVACYDFWNSRNLSPASSNFNNTRQELSSPRDNAIVLAWLDQVRAEVVHVHSLEGQALDLIATIRDTGRPVVVTTHNYWFACPQVDLARRGRWLCRDFEGGAACAGCLEAPAPGSARRNRAVEQSMHRTFGPNAAGTGKQAFKLVKAKIGRIGKARPEPFYGHESKPDPEASLGFTVEPDDGHDGLIDHGYELHTDEKPFDLRPLEPDENERFLGADCHLRVLDANVYGQRRLAGIAALNAASLVTPPSRFVLRVYEAMGLAPDRGRHVRLGQPHFDQINRRVRRSRFYDRRPWSAPDPERPLRLAYFGTTRDHKGLEVLARAIPMLEKGIRQRCQFVVRAGGWNWPFRKRLSAYPEVSFLGGYDTLHLISAPGEYDVGILPHIWFENSPLVLLEHLHAGKFVLASRLGGPPEWIHEPTADDPGNGLLFRAGDPGALADCIRRLASGEVVVPSPREVHDRSELRSYPDHVAEVESIYRGLLEGHAKPVVETALPRRVVPSP